MDNLLLGVLLDLFRPAPSAASAPPKVAPAPDTIPDDCLTFVEDEEDGSAAYYVAHYQHFEWPAGSSGPTIGIGYDCGYVTAAEATADWVGIVDDATLAAILCAVGKRGALAQAFVRASAGSVTITWDQALAEFKTREVPKWLDRCRGALPNFDGLAPDCRGALFSLTYNRGTGGYDDPGPRYAEMRAIKHLMGTRNLSTIPGQILSMQRLWPKGSDLWRRRAHEAVLFQQGLATKPAS